MAPVYFDSSALVKLVVDEVGSDLVASLWNGCDVAVTSRLAYPEVCAALASAGRSHDLSDADALDADSEWEHFWAAIAPVELTAEIAVRSGALAREQRLRGADAVHLASALALEGTDVVFAAWDRRLHSGAVASGLVVAPLHLD